MNDAKSSALDTRIRDNLAALSAALHPKITEFARILAEEHKADVAVFYGSNLRTGSLEGVLDFYLLHKGEQKERIWPRVSYHEREIGGEILRAKVAFMALSQFQKAAAGQTRDTTIWARFVQPSGLVWSSDEEAAGLLLEALASAATTAARFAAALGPVRGQAEDYWRALFRATYKAELRVEKPGRENDILSVNAAHFDGLLPLAWQAGGLSYEQVDGVFTPHLEEAARQWIFRVWGRCVRWGKPLNIVRLGKASTTFEGAAHYAAWKIERHTGVKLVVSPMAERRPLLAAPWALFKIWQIKRAQKKG